MVRNLVDRLSFRQAVNAVLVAILLSLVVTVLQLLHDARNERQAIVATTTQVVGIVRAAAEKSAYDLDPILAQEVLEGLFGYAPVFRATIHDELGSLLAERSRPLAESRLRWLSEELFGDVVEVSVPLRFVRPPDDGTGIQIGTLTVAVDTHRIATAFLERAGATVVSTLVSNLLLGLVLTLVFQHMVTRPILNVARDLAQIRPEMPGGSRLSVPNGHGRSELGFLVSRTNDLLARYDATLKQRDAYMEDMIAARRRAEEASRSKSQFLATISHELRTPLNAIIGFSQIIKEDAPSTGPLAIHADFAEEIHLSGLHLLTIINDILDLSNLETGRTAPEPETLDVRILVESCARQIAPKIETAGLTLVVDLDPAADRLFADPRCTRQVLMHLLSNAVKFTPAGGIVTVKSRREEDEVALAIADTGIGIADKDLPRIFQPFWQAAPVLSRRHEGTGLGLTMVKALVEMNGGAITVDSALDVGTTATVRLPATAAGAAAPRTAEPVTA